MKQLESIFDQQEQVAAAAGSDEELREERAVIRFSVAGSVFVVDIESVIEVTELIQMVRYPESHFGHIGIVNLRGNIVPVLAFREQETESPGMTKENRLLVLEFTPGKRFCTPVSSPKKVNLVRDPEHAGQNVVAIDGIPAQVISERDFPAARLSQQGGQPS